MKKFFKSLILALLLFTSFNAFCVPVFNSFPSAQATIFLDFDGAYVESSVWNAGNPISCAAATMTTAQITESFNRVAEDYRPFNVNVTTDSTVFLAAPLEKRIRIIITPTSSWMYAGFSGVSYIGSFTWGDDTPAFVFSDRLGNSPKFIGECISHEAGHTVGLSHQSKYDGVNCDSPIEQYNTGYGSGETGWSPIMGNSLNRNFSTWSDGPTPYGCTSMQDNLTIITTQNGFGYRTDDYGEVLDATTFTLGNNFSIDGIIATPTDKDAFKFTLNSNANFHLTAIPFNVQANWIGANLDIRIELYNASQQLVRDYNPMDILSVTMDTVLSAGTYYMKIYGTGNANGGAYGSLGQYTITGSFAGLPIHNVNLTGTADKGKHNLNWRIIADEQIKTIEVQASSNGTDFLPLSSLSGASTKFSYEPNKTNLVFYRLKVTSVLDQTVYSNIIALKNTDNQKVFTVSTLVQNEITINAAANYKYVLYDVNGRAVNSGNGLSGINHVNATNLSKGMYIIQILNNDQKQTERIIKQ